MVSGTPWHLALRRDKFPPSLVGDCHRSRFRRLRCLPTKRAGPPLAETNPIRERDRQRGCKSRQLMGRLAGLGGTWVFGLGHWCGATKYPLARGRAGLPAGDVDGGRHHQLLPAHDGSAAAFHGNPGRTLRAELGPQISRLHVRSHRGLIRCGHGAGSCRAAGRDSRVGWSGDGWLVADAVGQTSSQRCPGGRDGWNSMGLVFWSGCLAAAKEVAANQTAA